MINKNFLIITLLFFLSCGKEKKIENKRIESPKVAIEDDKSTVLDHPKNDSDLNLSLPERHVKEQLFVTQNSENRSNTCERNFSVAEHDPLSKQTFMVWAGPNSRPQIQSYNHISDEWSPIKDLGALDGGNTNVYKNEIIGSDVHNYPTMLISNDGHIHVFVASHHFYLRHYRSPYPYSLDGKWTWENLGDVRIPGQVKNLKPGYPMPIKTSSGDIFVFFRNDEDRHRTTLNKPHSYIKSSDNGLTWGEVKHVIKHRLNTSEELAKLPLLQKSIEQRDTIYMGNTKYMPKSKNHGEKFLMSWTKAGPKSNGTGLYDGVHDNLYFASMDIETGNMHCLNEDPKKPIGTYVDEIEADSYCLVLSTPLKDEYSIEYNPLVHYRESDGAPIIFFSQMTDYVKKDSILRIADWNGTSWHVYTPILSNTASENWKLIHSTQHVIERLDNTDDTFRLYITNNNDLYSYILDERGFKSVKKRTAIFENKLDIRQKIRKVGLVNNYDPEIKLFIGGFEEGVEWNSIEGFKGILPTFVAGTKKITPVIIQAEDAKFNNGFDIIEDSEAFGREYIIASGVSDYNHSQKQFLEFDIYTKKKGLYQLSGWVKGEDGQSDSFFVEHQKNFTTWHIPQKQNFAPSWVRPQGFPMFENQNNSVKIYLREQSAMIDKLQVSKRNYIWNNVIEVEAEELDAILEPMQIKNDSTASGKKYVSVSSGKNNYKKMAGNGYVEYNFQLTSSKKIKFSMRLKPESTVAKDDSFFLDLAGDNIAPELWDGHINSKEWKWYDWKTVTLPPGKYTWKIGYREDGTLLDKIRISTIN